MPITSFFSQEKSPPTRIRRNERRHPMSGSDILSLVSLLGSAFAFFVALLTYVYTVALGPRLKLLFGEQLALHYSSSKQLYIWSNFAFFNEGAKPGAIVELAGTISAGDGRNQSLRWD